MLLAPPEAAYWRKEWRRRALIYLWHRKPGWALIALGRSYEPQPPIDWDRHREPQQWQFDRDHGAYHFHGLAPVRLKRKANRSR